MWRDLKAIAQKNGWSIEAFLRNDEKRCNSLAPYVYCALRPVGPYMPHQRCPWASHSSPNQSTSFPPFGSTVSVSAHSRQPEQLYRSINRVADHRTPQGGTCLREAWPTATARHRRHERDFAAGVHPKAIQERLGHGSNSVTLDQLQFRRLDA